MKYFGNWTDHAGMVKDFSTGWGEVFDVPGIATDAEVVVASYEYGSYDGAAFVLFRREGRLYEVNGSHCSCYGLEGQWEPEETTPEALAMRKFGDYSGLTDPQGLALLAPIIATAKAVQ